MKLVADVTELAKNKLRIPDIIPFTDWNEIVIPILDKEDLSENHLDGHGYWKNSADKKSYVVFVCSGFPLVFFFHDNIIMEKRYYTWCCLGEQDWVKNKDVPKSSLKMKARF